MKFVKKNTNKEGTCMETGQPVAAGNAARRPARKKKNQLPAALILLAAIIGFAFLVGGISPVLAISWIFGIGFGVVLQKSRFCFTAAFRDPVLTGSTSLTKAVLVAIAVALVGFSFIQFHAVESGAGLPGAVNPVGPHVAIGALLFGIGAVISGGCASGTLMRVGEGFQMQWLSLIFFVIGSVWGAHDFSWWRQMMIDAAPKIHIPSVLGWAGGILLQLATLGALYALAEWWGKRRSL
jgi:uncharacterized membrane protein YedE/YeeE